MFTGIVTAVGQVRHAVAARRLIAETRQKLELHVAEVALGA